MTEDYVVITREGCSFCREAGKLLQEEDKRFQFIYLEDEPYLAKLLSMAALRTVPQVFLGNTYIGGYSELQEHLGNDD